MKKGSTSREILMLAIGAVFSVIITAIYEFLKVRPVIQDMAGFINWLWLNVINFKISLWVVILIIFIMLIFKYIFRKPSVIPVTEEEDPDWMKYTGDSINGQNWSWVWEEDVNVKGDFHPKYLNIECDMCRTPMNITRSYRYGDSATCPRCGNTMMEPLIESNVRTLIIDNIRKGIYKSAINRK